MAKLERQKQSGTFFQTRCISRAREVSERSSKIGPGISIIVHVRTRRVGKSRTYSTSILLLISQAIRWRKWAPYMGALSAAGWTWSTQQACCQQQAQCRLAQLLTVHVHWLHVYCVVL